jgi:hypothetical protein
MRCRYISEDCGGVPLHPVDVIDAATGAMLDQLVDLNLPNICPVNKPHPRSVAWPRVPGRVWVSMDAHCNTCAPTHAPARAPTRPLRACGTSHTCLASHTAGPADAGRTSLLAGARDRCMRGSLHTMLMMMMRRRGEGGSGGRERRRVPMGRVPRGLGVVAGRSSCRWVGRSGVRALRACVRW